MWSLQLRDLDDDGLSRCSKSESLSLRLPRRFGLNSHREGFDSPWLEKIVNKNVWLKLFESSFYKVIYFEYQQNIIRSHFKIQDSTKFSVLRRQNPTSIATREKFVTLLERNFQFFIRLSFSFQLGGKSDCRRCWDNIWVEKCIVCVLSLRAVLVEETFWCNKSEVICEKKFSFSIEFAGKV